MERQRSIQHSNKINWVERLNPVLPKRWLLILAGIMWTAVGFMLLAYAVSWLSIQFSVTSVLLGMLGVTLSVVAYRFLFLELARLC